MVSDKMAAWKITNKLTRHTLETAHYQRGRQRKYERLQANQSKTYESLGKEGRIALRVHRPNGFRVEFGDNDLPGWIEVNPKDQQFNTVVFPNGGGNESGINNGEQTVTVTDPE